MAEPGDPEPKTHRPVDDPDLHVGFVTPYSLTGQTRTPLEPEPEPELPPVVEPEPEPAAEPDLPEDPAFEPDAADEPDLFDTPEPAVATPEPEPELEPEPVVVEAPEPIPPVIAPEPEPVAALEPAPAPEPKPYVAAPPPITAPPPYGRSTSPREVLRDRPQPKTPPAAPLGLYAVYALILFAVPTLGVSAAIALLAVTGRDAPRDAVAGSHFIFQQRTLWAGAVAALLGVILIVINIGVFVLFLLALWLMARGVWGLLRLMGGKPVNNPRSWLF